MLDYKQDDIVLFKAFLRGSEEALQRAYRRSITTLAKFELEFGAESIPDDLEFRWEWIDGYRVLTIATDGSGIRVDFHDIDGIEEKVYVLYSSWPPIYQSNDIEGKILPRKELFRIREADYEVGRDLTPEEVRLELSSLDVNEDADEDDYENEEPKENI